MQVFEQSSNLLEALKEYRTQGTKIGFVPTMGALHKGHLSLIAKSKSDCEITVCSIYVNPTQFNDKADFERYPRDFNADLNILRLAKCDFVYMPAQADVYPNGLDHILDFDIPSLTTRMEGKYRPGFLQGVITVVMALFDNVQPDFAYFGLKDYQQYLMVKGAAKHYNKTVEVRGMETIREKNGLAMSSRNRLLTSEERSRAGILFSAMSELAKEKGKSDLNNAVLNAFAKIQNSGLEAEYVEVCEDDSLIPVNSWNTNGKYVVLCAAKCGKVRLMDNLSF